MPKVTDQYLFEKKTFILECTEEILKEKPLYLITMRDIIKKARFSQGVIYRYYTNIHEIYVDFINKHTVDILLNERIDMLLDSEQPEKIILTKCFVEMGKYIEELLKSIAGKAFFELMVLYAYDYEKRAEVFPKLKFKQNLEYVQKRIVDYVISNVEKGIFQPQIPVISIIMFVSSSIDGISQNAAITMSEGHNDNSSLATDVPELFRTLSKAVINFLEDNNND